MHLHFDIQLQCIQISTRINSSSVHTYIFVCFIRNHSNNTTIPTKTSFAFYIDTAKITDKDVFLDIIKQVQLPSVKVEIRTVEEMEKMEGKTYRQLTLMCHLPNFKRINPIAKEQTRTMAAYMYCILYKQITGVRVSQTGCATDFKAPMMPFKRLITGKRQPGGPGRSSEARGGSSRSLEDVTEMEGATPAKRTRKATKSATATKVTPKGRGKKSK